MRASAVVGKTREPFFLSLRALRWRSNFLRRGVSRRGWPFAQLHSWHNPPNHIARGPARAHASPATQKKPAVKINKPPILFPQTQKIIAKIEKKLDGPFIAYWSSGNGSVCHNDVAASFEVLKELGPQKRIYLFIKSNGGNGQAALRIVNLLRQYAQRITALVPLECA